MLINSKLEGAGQSAIYRALMGAQELRKAGDDVVIVFDGAGSTAAAEMAQSGHRFRPFTDVLPRCARCLPLLRQSYGVLDAVRSGRAASGMTAGMRACARCCSKVARIITF